jgi:hypothetical protein
VEPVRSVPGYPLFISRYDAERKQLFPVYAVMHSWAVEKARQRQRTLVPWNAQAILSLLVVNELRSTALSNRSAENRAAQSCICPAVVKGEALGVFQVQGAVVLR